jgi:hypothetical protein
MVGFWTFSEPGGHVTNEDAFLVRPHPDDELVWLCALGDGQGGRAGGARASQWACQVLIESAIQHSVQRLAEPGTWVTILRRADNAVQSDGEAGLTTLIGFCVSHQTVIGASNGDSAMVVFGGDNYVRDLTRDQQKNPPVGSGFAAIVPFGTRLPQSWTVLAMSDGVWKYCGWDRIRKCGSNLRGEALIEALQQSARLPGRGTFPDDFTVVAFQDGD